MKDRQRPDPARYDRQRDEIVARLGSRRQSEVEAAWMKTLRDGASIKVNDALLRAAAAPQDQ